MRVIIPSKNRSDKVVSMTLRWFSEAILCVDEIEERDYRAIGAPMMLHPALPNLPTIINWILETVEEDHFCIVDDDLIRVESIVGSKPTRIDDNGDIMQIVENCYELAGGFGARLWGFSVNRRGDSNYSYRPFSLAARIGCFRGISDRSMRMDTRFQRHDDADLVLSRLLIDRVVFRDDRFDFIFAPIYKTAGGSSDVYRESNEEEERKLLKQKWGDYIHFVSARHHANETRISVNR